MIHHLGTHNGRRLNIHSHCLERYVQRVKPALTEDQALTELRFLLQHAQRGGPPDWLANRSSLRHERNWLHLTDHIAFTIGIRPPHPPLLTTVVTRGSISDEATELRQKRRRKHRHVFKRDIGNPIEQTPPRPRFDEDAA